MKLLAKINLALLVVFLAWLALTGYGSWSLLQRNARAEITREARVLLDAATAVRVYTMQQIQPLLEPQAPFAFLSQSVPAYSAREVISGFRMRNPQYRFKETMLNPTNPANRPVAWESEIIEKFRADAERKEISGDGDGPEGPYHYIARVIRIGDEACLRCHGVAADAPKTMVEAYGATNGFGWAVGTVGAQIVSVPTKVVFERAREAFVFHMASIAGAFVLTAIVLNLALWRAVVRPVASLSRFADAATADAANLGKLNFSSRDEIGRLAESIGRMRTRITER